MAEDHGGRKQHPGSKSEESDAASTEIAPFGAGKGDALKADIDGLLAEIDSVLTDDAQEFVANFRQKGGQ